MKCLGAGDKFREVIDHPYRLDQPPDPLPYVNWQCRILNQEAIKCLELGPRRSDRLVEFSFRCQSGGAKPEPPGLKSRSQADEEVGVVDRLGYAVRFSAKGNGPAVKAELSCGEGHPLVVGVDIAAQVAGQRTEPPLD
jgi:hypothetical protein